MEFKVWQQDRSGTRPRVDIETEWNLNHDIDDKWGTDHTVDIETELILKYDSMTAPAPAPE